MILGICLCLFGAVCNNLGNNIQSLGLEKRIAAEAQALAAVVSGCTVQKELGLNLTWVVGTVIYVLGAFLLFGSFALAPASILAPLESVQFVTNIIFGRVVLKRRVPCLMVVGTVLTVAGTVLAVTSGSHSAQTFTIEDLLDHWRAPGWIAFVVMLAMMTICCLLAYRVYDRKKAEGKPLPGHWLVSPICYAAFSAAIGTQSVVHVKCLSELLELWTTTTEGVDIWVHWYTYVTILAWLSMILTWIYLLNKAIAFYDPLFMLPLMQANFIFFAVLSGGVFFQEFDEFKPIQWVLFFSGVGVMLVGISMIVVFQLPKDTQTRQVHPQRPPPKEVCPPGLFISTTLS